MDFRLLGPVEVWAENERLEPGTGKQRCVLAALLIDAGRLLTPETLIDRVWGDDPPSQVRSALYSYISRSRRALKPTGVTIGQRSGGYVLEVAPERIDVRCFDELSDRAFAAEDPVVRASLLDEALGLWRGEPLADVAGRWAEDVRRRLSRRRVRVCAEWAGCAVGMGDAVVAADRLERELLRNPLAEPLVGQLMLAYRAQDRLAEALASFAVFRERLVDELGAEPGPVLQNLHMRLLRGESPGSCRLPAGPERRTPDSLPAPAAEIAAEVPGHEGRPPYLGLATFEESDADRFFGRQELVEEILARLESHRFLSVFGPSGSGKSSFLRAGLLAAIPRRAFPGWATRLVTPGEHPLGALAGDRRARELAVDPAGVATLFSRPVVLVVDQFEEVFTLCRDELERARFVEALVCLAENPVVAARVVIGVRADFYPACAAYPALVALLRDQQFLVGPMSESELHAVIIEPAAAAGFAVDPVLADTVVAEVLGEPAVLPLVSHVLLETWRRREGDRLTLAAYHTAGGVRGAVAQTADKLFRELDPRQAKIAREVFLRLTAPGDGAADTRRRPRRAELVAQGNAGEIAEVLDRLAAARLVTVDEETVTVVHESLIRSWPALRGWIEEDREFLRARGRLTDHASEWEQHVRDDDLLYTGARLALWNTFDTRRLNDLERAFLTACRRRVSRQELRKRRRARAWLAGLSTAVAVLLVLTAVAVRQTEQATEQRDRATAGRLVAGARGQLAIDPELALLLARQAYARAPDGVTESALAQALTASRVRKTFTGHQGQVTSMCFSADGSRLVSGGGDGSVRVHAVPGGGSSVLPGGGLPVVALACGADGRIAAAREDGAITLWEDGKPREAGRGPVGVLAVAFSGAVVFAVGRDGNLWTSAAGQVRRGPFEDLRAAAFDARAGKLAGADDSGRVRVWDLSTGASTVLREPGSSIDRVVFSHDGRLVAGGRPDGREEVWAVAGDRPPVVLYPNRDAVHALAFSHDGKTLASGAHDRTGHLWLLNPALRDYNPLRGQAGPIRDIAFAPQDRFIATAGDDGTVRLWEPDTRPELRVLDGHSGPVLDTAFSPDGTRVASASADGTVLVQDPGGAPNPVILRGHRGPVEATAFSPDGRFVAGAGDDGTVRTWAASGGDAVSVHIGQGGVAWALAFSADGAFLAAGHEDGTIEKWRRDGTGQPLVLHAPAGVRDLVFLPDGKLAAAVADGTVRVWPPAGEPVVVLRGADGMRTVAVTPDGQFVAGAGNDGVVRVWRVTGGPPAATLEGHYGLVFGVAFSSDGQYVAAAGNDRKVMIWNWAHWRDPVVFDDYNATVPSIAFGAGNRIAVGRGDDNDAVEVWRCDFCLSPDRFGDLAELARVRSTRDLTDAERDRYLDDHPG
jgi:WD40 repeat protein/DNA-binding SARP family transcriptional activator